VRDCTGDGLGLGLGQKDQVKKREKKLLKIVRKFIFILILRKKQLFYISSIVFDSRKGCLLIKNYVQ